MVWEPATPASGGPEARRRGPARPKTTTETDHNVDAEHRESDTAGGHARDESGLGYARSDTEGSPGPQASGRSPITTVGTGNESTSNANKDC